MAVKGATGTPSLFVGHDWNGKFNIALVACRKTEKKKKKGTKEKQFQILGS
jgi:hypothetical protein